MFKWLTNLIPGVSEAKTIFYVVLVGSVITIAGLAFWHYNNMANELATQKAQNQTLQNAIAVQDVTIAKSLDTIKDWQAANKKLQQTISGLQQINQQASEALGRLNDIYSKHDLTQLSYKNPTAIEHIINNASARAMLMLKCASGSKDNDCSSGSTGTGQNTVSAKSVTHTSLLDSLDSNNKGSPTTR